MKKVEIDKPVSELKPLDVKCSDTKCKEGFHYFTSDVKSKQGICKKCSDDSIEWNRLHKRDIQDVSYVVECLNKELLRHVCWNNPIEVGAIEKAKDRGAIELRKKTKELLSKAIGKPPEAYWDNMGTKKKGSEIIHYAQHATATCCRKCAKHWHNIPLDENLTEEQMNYFEKLIEYYIKQKLQSVELEMKS
jgi:hypothetical protein